MLFWMVMFTYLVHHIHQFGCISFHLLFLMSECGLFCCELWYLELLNVLKHPAARVNHTCLLICAHFILALSWTITLSGKVMFGWRVQCVHQPLHSPLLFSASESRDYGRSFWMFEALGRHQAARLVPQWINWNVLSMCLIVSCPSDGLLHYGVESHLFLYGRFMSLHTKWEV